MKGKMKTFKNVMFSKVLDESSIDKVVLTQETNLIVLWHVTKEDAKVLLYWDKDQKNQAIEESVERALKMIADKNPKADLLNELVGV